MPSGASESCNLIPNCFAAFSNLGLISSLSFLPALLYISSIRRYFCLSFSSSLILCKLLYQALNSGSLSKLANNSGDKASYPPSSNFSNSLSASAGSLTYFKIMLSSASMLSSSNTVGIFSLISSSLRDLKCLVNSFAKTSTLTIASPEGLTPTSTNSLSKEKSTKCNLSSLTSNVNSSSKSFLYLT